MKNAVMLPNDVTSDGSRADYESTRPNVRSISNKKRPSRAESGNRNFQRPTLTLISNDSGNVQR